MTNEEAIKKLKSFCHNCSKYPQCVNTDRECFEALDMAIRALKNEQTDGDLISRKDLLKDIADLKKSPWFNEGKDIKDLFQRNSYVARKEAVEIIEDLCIKNMQSAEKTAKGNTTELYWLQYDANPRIGNWHCTKCNMIVSVQNPNYCPNCGRKMKGAEK